MAFLIGFFAPFIPSIIGIYISTNYIDDFVTSTNILSLSIFALPIICIGLLVYEYKKERKAMMGGTGLSFLSSLLQYQNTFQCSLSEGSTVFNIEPSVVIGKF